MSLLHSRRLFLCLLPVTVLACSPAVQFTHGVAAGDVTDSSVVLWTRTDVPAPLHLEVTSDGERHDRSSRSEAAADGTAQILVDGLRPATEYQYRFTAGGPFRRAHAAGTFRTAPAPAADALPRFVVVGDVGGQGFCRHADTGYDAFSRMADLGADAVIANGDLIYADGTCPAQGPGEWTNLPGDFPSVADVDWTAPGVREAIDAHWRYNRADLHQQRLLRSTPVYAQWDDHEVINDFGAGWDRWPHQPDKPGYRQLVAAGRDAFFGWNPIARNATEPNRIYRSFRWGRHLELFLLDGRTYRSPNGMPDGPGKTLLGEAQREWLVSSVLASDATWKVISSDVPLTLPTGWPEDYGRDAFADGVLGDGRAGTPEATGAEDELVDILRRLDAGGVDHLVVLATDVHFAMSLRWSKDFDGDGRPLTVHELISGPLNAVSVPVKEPDPSFGPQVLYAEGEFFNFATLRLERAADGEAVHLVYDVRGAADGAVRPGSRLLLSPLGSP